MFDSKTLCVLSLAIPLLLGSSTPAGIDEDGSEKPQPVILACTSRPEVQAVVASPPPAPLKGGEACSMGLRQGPDREMDPQQ